MSECDRHPRSFNIHESRSSLEDSARKGRVQCYAQGWAWDKDQGQNGTGLAQQETMGSGPCPCLGPVWTFLHNILEPINLSPVPCSIPGPGRMQCEYNISHRDSLLL